MPESGNTYVSAAVEGPTDAAAAERLILEVGAQPGPIYIRDGKTELLRRAGAYDNAAKFSPWLVLVDLDHDEDCAPPARNRWLPNPAPRMCFRVVVREIESWFLADRANLAQFLRIPVGRIPAAPEQIDHPKHEMIRAARNSRSRAIRADIIPRAGSGRETGPAYSSRMIEFAQTRWSPSMAARSAPSLARAITCLQRACRIASLLEG